MQSRALLKRTHIEQTQEVLLDTEGLAHSVALINQQRKRHTAQLVAEGGLGLCVLAADAQHCIGREHLIVVMSKHNSRYQPARQWAQRHDCANSCATHQRHQLF